MSLSSPFPPCFRSNPPHKLFSTSLHFLALHPPCKRFAVFASSARKPRKVRSNDDLCNDLREFVSAVGLPEGHVPTTKELQHHGRKELANTVRRRGYKLIKELLTNSKVTDADRSNIVKNLTETHDAASGQKDDLTGQDEKVNNLTDNFSSSSEDLSSLNEWIVGLQSSTYPILKEKAAKFIQNGELDSIEDNGYGVLNEGDAENVKELIGTGNAIEIASSTLNEADHLLSGSSIATMLNGRILTSEQDVALATENRLPGDDHLSHEGQTDDFDFEANKKEKQVEISDLKFMLRQKELELSRLKEQIEKEKLALSILQTKAETEISKAKKLISEKDAEIHAAEESLLGLKEVEILYSGDGEVVEVAGSFNGWHNRIKMDPQSSSSIISSIGSRKSKLWSRVLWLYPGVYEIKFIVDSHWKIDPERESVSRGTIHNNILRVER